VTRGRALGAAAWTVVALDVLALGLIVIGVLPAPSPSPAGGSWIFLVLAVTFGVVGARVVTRDPSNRVGWAVWLQPTLIALSGAGVGYAQLSVDQHDASLPGTTMLAWAGGSSLVLFILLTALLIPLLFPTGRLRSARWRPVAAIAAAAIGLTMAGMLLDPAPLLPGVANPIGVPGAEQILESMRQLGAVCILVSLPLVVASVVVRFRQGGSVEREQVKWFAAGVLVPATLLVASLAMQDIEWLWVASVAGLGLIPVAIGIAVLRYRLYEIDRIISRTIGWALVTGILVAVFTGLVVALQAVLAPVTNENTLAVAGSTLVAAALFQPLRRRVQRAVDRRFDRARYDGQRTLDAFAEQLRNEVDLNTLLTSLATTASDAVLPAGSSVWLRPEKAHG